MKYNLWDDGPKKGFIVFEISYAEPTDNVHEYRIEYVQ